MKLKVTLLLLPLLLLAGCQDEEAPAVTEERPASEESAAATGSSAAENVDAVAWVNGEPISKEMLEFHLMRRSQGQPEQLPPEAREHLLNELVELTLLSQEAERMGLADDPEVAVRVESMRRAVLAQAVAERATQNQDEAALRAQYEERYTDSGEQYHARHILLEDEETAQQVIEKLQAGGDFAELAKEHSTGPTGPGGGDLGWFELEHMVPEFSEATAKLEPGNYTTEPVQTQFGYHVIKLEGKRPIPAPSFEEVRPELEGEAAQGAVQAKIEELRNQAEIRFTNEELAPTESE